mmetsp:Transcript_37467/g.74919  ORF Transcript_37467/g.74919 Transcript_37467/m.74919 type:complete len:231 (-) Transcript_37467:138-830(-)
MEERDARAEHEAISTRLSAREQHMPEDMQCSRSPPNHERSCLTAAERSVGRTRQPRLERLRLLPPNVLSALRDNARRCSEPVRRAISLTTWLRCSTVSTPSCIAQSIASRATPSDRTWERESMTACESCVMVTDMGWLSLGEVGVESPPRGVVSLSSSHGSPSICTGSLALLLEVIVTDEHWQRRWALVSENCASPSCITPLTATTSNCLSSMDAVLKRSPGGVFCRVGH